MTYEGTYSIFNSKSRGWTGFPRLSGLVFVVVAAAAFFFVVAVATTTTASVAAAFVAASFTPVVAATGKGKLPV